jgi:hypothetical protein
VVEGELWVEPTAKGTVYTSSTERDGDKMTLILRYDKGNRLVAAEAALANPQGKRHAVMTFQGGMALVKRGGVTDFHRLTGEPVVVSPPDWGDVLQVVRRYDRKKGGQQEFAGLTLHPNFPPQASSLTIERQGINSIGMPGENATMLERYQVRNRAGEYTVWADASGRVYKLVSRQPNATPVVLDGQEEATRELQP